MTVSIGVISDLHTEDTDLDLWSRIRPPHDKVSILILAGDIGNPHWAYGRLYSILSWCLLWYPLTLYVPGNHEYRHSPEYHRRPTPELANKSLKTDLLLSEMVDRLNLRAVNSGHQIHLLNKDVFECQVNQIQLKFIGATLWSYVDPKASVVEERDSFIFNEQRNSWHLDQLEFIAQQINTHRQDNSASILIVITHHPPISDYAYGDHACYYGNQLSDYLAQTDYWVCGHVHQVSTWESDWNLISPDNLKINPLGRLEEETNRRVQILEVRR